MPPDPECTDTMLGAVEGALVKSKLVSASCRVVAVILANDSVSA